MLGERVGGGRGGGGVLEEVAVGSEVGTGGGLDALGLG